MIQIEMFQKVSADFNQTITLDGNQFNLRCTWNTREEAWYLDINNAVGSPLLVGSRLSPDTPIIRKYGNDKLPKGEIMLYDTKQDPSNSKVTFDNLGGRYILVYITAKELL